MLMHIIAESRLGGYERLSLETGVNEAFAAARHLYEKFGFVECEPFAKYKPDPSSCFMTLAL